MEWLSKMNDAIGYMESNITEKVDYTQAASIACCSLTRFQNMFLFITDITPSEYVRRRRMALSAAELINGDIKIIDLALKYAYESPEAFTRSFRAFHGISPSETRKSGKYIDYPRISFQLKIIGGHFSMDNKTNMEAYQGILFKMEIIELAETLKFAGLPSENLPDFQNIDVYCQKYRDVMTAKYTPYTEIGISTDFNANSKGWDYLFGCQVNSIGGLPEGLVGIDTGLKKFVCLTFRVQPGVDMLGGSDGAGSGMKMGREYLENEWIPKNKDLLYNYTPEHGYKMDKATSSYKFSYCPACTSIEVYKDPHSADKEMCYYLPLK